MSVTPTTTLTDLDNISLGMNFKTISFLRGMLLRENGLIRLSNS